MCNNYWSLKTDGISTHLPSSSLRSRSQLPSLAVFMAKLFGGFHKWALNGGTPSHHPFLDGIFPYKPSIMGYPLSWNPHLGYVGWSPKRSRDGVETRSPQMTFHRGKALVLWIYQFVYLSTLSYPVLSYPILSYLILSYLILSYLISSYLILSYLISFYIILSYIILFCLIFFLSYLILSSLI